MTGEFDVVVVGCGPAGATAAYRLASAGARVLMLEKEALPRDKVCGGGVSAKAIREAPFPLLPVVERHARSALVAYGGASAVPCERPGIGGMTRRAVLDSFMTGKAVAAGAVLRERSAFEGFEQHGDALEVRTSGGTVAARVLVGADGVHSRVRRQLFPGPAPPAVAAVEALLWPAPGMLEVVGDTCVFDLGAIPGGYGWIFPKRDHLNVGLYRFVKRPDNVDMRALLEGYIARTPVLRSYERIAVKGYPIPVRPVAPRLASRGVVLVGDAAGVADPLFGEGIYFAIRSGNLAADAIAAALEGRASLAAYDRAMRGLRFDLAAARLAARLLYASPRLGFRFGVRDPLVCRLFMGVIEGAVSPARALAGMAALVPHMLVARPTPPVDSPIFA